MTRMVSLIVPTKDNAATIDACLRSLASQNGPCELIVVDNHSTDGTTDIARRHADVLLVRGPERSAQRNAGAEAATGEILVFLDSDMVAQPDLLDSVVTAFDSQDVGALVLPELAFGVGFWASCRSLEKELYQGDDRVEAARAFRRVAFEAVGGYDESLTGGEDWELPDRLREAGWRIARAATVVHHDEGRIRFRTVFSKKRYYGRGVAQLVARDRRKSAAHFNRLGHLARAIRMSPLRGMGLLVLKSAEAAGLAVGIVEARRGSR